MVNKVEFMKILQNDKLSWAFYSWKVWQTYQVFDLLLTILLKIK